VCCLKRSAPEKIGEFYTRTLRMAAVQENDKNGDWLPWCQSMGMYVSRDELRDRILAGTRMVVVDVRDDDRQGVSSSARCPCDASRSAVSRAFLFLEHCYKSGSAAHVWRRATSWAAFTCRTGATGPSTCRSCCRSLSARNSPRPPPQSGSCSIAWRASEGGRDVRADSFKR